MQRAFFPEVMFSCSKTLLLTTQTGDDLVFTWQFRAAAPRDDPARAAAAAASVGAAPSAGGGAGGAGGRDVRDRVMHIDDPATHVVG
jgi:hypothetical protein